MCIGIRLPMISSFSLRLLCGFYAIFLFPFPLQTIFLSCVPQTTLLLNVTRLSLGHDSRIQQLLPPIQLHLVLLHPHLLLPFLRADVDGYAPEASPPPPPLVASDSEDKDDDDGDDDDASDDDNGDASSTNEMST